jgi:hypothetical protein
MHCSRDECIAKSGNVFRSRLIRRFAESMVIHDDLSG